ncbi:MAG TPA: VTT domain-containing protein [Elusimicrobiota bacterium]|nr:VTT domain-containing protein [Elusimicrobiota bacterium]
MMSAFIDMVSVLQGHPWAPPAFVAVSALACLCLPITPFYVAGGFLFGFWGGLLCNVAGTLLGTGLAFLLARRLAYGRFKAWILRKYPAVAALSESMDFRVVLVARLTGFPPFWLMNYLPGLSGIRWRSYAAGTFAGTLPWIVIVSFFSHTLWNVLVASGLKGLGHALAVHSRPLFYAGLILAGGMILTSFLKKRWAGKTPAGKHVSGKTV